MEISFPRRLYAGGRKAQRGGDVVGYRHDVRDQPDSIRTRNAKWAAMRGDLATERVEVAVLPFFEIENPTSELRVSDRIDHLTRAEESLELREAIPEFVSPRQPGRAFLAEEVKYLPELLQGLDGL